MSFLPFTGAQTRSENLGDAPALLSTPYLIQRGWQFLGTISDPDDEDWVEVFLPGSSRFSVTGVFVQFQVAGVGDTPLTDAKITLHNEQGTEISHLFFPQIDQGFDDHFYFALPQSGTVFASVESKSGTTQGDYALQVVYLGSYFQGTARSESYDFSTSSNTDLVRSFAGNDTIGTEGGDDSIYAGDGDDSINTGNDDDLIFGGRGNDTVNAGDGADTVHGGDGNDTILGGHGDDSIYAGSGADSIITGSGDDLIFGGRGNDTVNAGDGTDTVHGGDGNDRLTVFGDGSVLFGETGNDTLVGGASSGSQTLVGGQGDDLVRSQGEGDVLRGGTGEDTVTYHGQDAIVLSLSDQTLNAGGAAGDMLTSIEAVRGSGWDDVISGNAFRNVMLGNDGNDTLDGAGGTDRLIGGRGDDMLTGGTGDDRLIGGEGADVFAFAASDGNDVILDFAVGEDVLRFAAETPVTVSNDGINTTIDYGCDSVLLEGVALEQADIVFEYV